jgi:CPA2 family monovalent cation:H+ antiporter-2
VEELRARDIPAVSGDASDPAVLIQAHVARAGMLVIAALEDPVRVRKMVAIARQLNPPIEVVLRTDKADEARLFERDSLGRIFLSEQELALGITRHILERMGMSSGEPSSDAGTVSGARWTEPTAKESK